MKVVNGKKKLLVAAGILVLLLVASTRDSHLAAGKQKVGPKPQKVEDQFVPRGALYFLTSNRDGRGRPRAGDDKIYRIVPEH
ncbi:MAG: hypothetical protein ACOC7U_06690 [Spirochaetota bacterium]